MKKDVVYSIQSTHKRDSTASHQHQSDSESTLYSSRKIIERLLKLGQPQNTPLLRSRSNSKEGHQQEDLNSLSSQRRFETAPNPLRRRQFSNQGT